MHTVQRTVIQLRVLPYYSSVIFSTAVLWNSYRTPLL